MNHNQIFPQTQLPAEIANMADLEVARLSCGCALTYQTLYNAFAAVTANMQDWRGPIDSEVVVPVDVEFVAASIIIEAVEFFTATTPRTFVRNGEIAVKAVGYRNGPAGP